MLARIFIAVPISQSRIIGVHRRRATKQVKPDLRIDGALPSGKGARPRRPASRRTRNRDPCGRSCSSRCRSRRRPGPLCISCSNRRGRRHRRCRTGMGPAPVARAEVLAFPDAAPHTNGPVHTRLRCPPAHASVRRALLQLRSCDEHHGSRRGRSAQRLRTRHHSDRQERWRWRVKPWLRCTR